jgi:hypothetical protein
MSPAAVKVRILCSCAWSGEVLTRGACGCCGADYTHRVTPTRLAKLRAIAGWREGMPSVSMEPGTAQWLNAGRHKLIKATPPGQGARPIARGSSYRCYEVTPLGERVLLAARLADRSDGLDQIRRDLANGGA